MSPLRPGGACGDTLPGGRCVSLGSFHSSNVYVRPRAAGVLDNAI